MPSALPAIRVEGLRKTFRIPKHRVHTFKERALHPLRRTTFDEFPVLRGIDFEVLKGEFFGIVGRNGSGKSTLLKCLAGIYRADAGTMQLAGRLSPFIELGVGFNPDLTARDNVVINAVMMGLSPREARARFDDIIAFAELEQFVDQKLKNYSSGMQVRLAFSVMVQSDADVLLIDEVLAVGDAAFQQKCFDVFYRLRDEGKTIVLVTHEMGLVQRFCHRAMMINNGRIAALGDPETVGRAYLNENFRERSGEEFERAQAPLVRLHDAWFSDALGSRISSIQHGENLQLHAVVEAVEEIENGAIVVWLSNEDRLRVFSVGARDSGGTALNPIVRGERVHVGVEVENPLASGRYYLGCSVTRGTTGAELLLAQDRAADLVVYGTEAVPGVVRLDHVQWTERLAPEIHHAEIHSS
jgi:ABC-type polysaccharide/polyol phosphate transport system ATPase subunit